MEANQCEQFKQTPSACEKDSDCTSVTGLGCFELIISKARLEEAEALKRGCQELCPATESGLNSSIPICEKQACTWRASTKSNPIDACLDRHLERFPNDRTPIVVEIRPQASGPSALAAGDEREVARCLEDRFKHTLSPRQQLATLTLTPGVPFMP